MESDADAVVDALVATLIENDVELVYVSDILGVSLAVTQALPIRLSVPIAVVEGSCDRVRVTWGEFEGDDDRLCFQDIEACADEERL